MCACSEAVLFPTQPQRLKYERVAQEMEECACSEPETPITRTEECACSEAERAQKRSARAQTPRYRSQEYARSEPDTLITGVRMPRTDTLIQPTEAQEGLLQVGRAGDLRE